MKKLLALSLALVGLGLYACGGDSGSGGTTNPNDAAAEFSNPTGKLTSSNATDVAKASLESAKANTASGFVALKKDNTSDFLNFAGKTLDSSSLAACVSTSGSTSTVDWACAAPIINPDCTGDGTTESTANSSTNVTEIVYNNFSLSCGGTTPYSFSCDGTMNISTDSAHLGYSCGDYTCTFNTFDVTFSGCTDPSGHHLIRVSGDSFVVEEVVTDGGCGTLTITLTDSTGSKTITCDVATHESTCSSASDVNTISNCTIN